MLIYDNMNVHEARTVHRETITAMDAGLMASIDRAFLNGLPVERLLVTASKMVAGTAHGVGAVRHGIPVPGAIFCIEYNDGKYVITWI